MRLFVDVDDTLVLWREELPTEGGLGRLYKGDEYVLNNDLFDAIQAYQRGDVELVVWSGGGMDYAAMWANKCWEPLAYVATAKDITLPQPGDVVVDDQHLKLREGVKQYTWQEFVQAGIPHGS